MSTSTNKKPQFNVVAEYGPQPAPQKLEENAVEVEIPFCGLYNSIISDGCDREAAYEEDSALDRWEDANEEEREELEKEYKELTLQLDMEDTYKQWIDMIAQLTSSTVGFLVPMKLVECWSPREYNFYNDHMTVGIDKETLQKVIDWILNNEEAKKALDEYVDKAVTPSSGYMPYYSWVDFEGWPLTLKPCQYELLFRAIMSVAGKESMGDLEEDFYYEWEPEFNEYRPN